MPDFSWFTDFINWIAQLASQDLETLLKAYGYYAIGILTFLEGETIVIIAGVFASKGMLNPYYIALCAFTGSFISDQVMFSLGKYKGSSILEKFPRIAKNVDNAARLLKKYDTYLILGFRFVYGVRNVTPILLGISGVSHMKFFVLNFIGAAVWAASFTAGGFFFGKIFEHAMASIGHSALYIIGGLIAVGALYWIIRTKKQNNLPPADSNANPPSTNNSSVKQ